MKWSRMESWQTKSRIGEHLQPHKKTLVDNRLIPLRLYKVWQSMLVETVANGNEH